MRGRFLLRAVTWLALFGFAPPPAAGQQAPVSPYRAEVASEIRGLSAQEIEDLGEGRGMGLARAAELNGYPGPRHLLGAVEARQLHLSAEQLGAVRRLFEAMTDEARRLGALILREEQRLESAFRAGPIRETDLQARVGRIAAFQGELRVLHLRTHLQTRVLLTDHQIERYNQIRGYGHEPGGPHPGRH